jgi:hypothetical protein
MSTPRKHRFNTSNTVKARIAKIIHILVAKANDLDRSLVEWRESEKSRPKLMVKCRTSEFIQLCYPNLDANKTETVRYNDMWVLREWLGILEDHRIGNTKGRKDLHFTLTLWSKQDRLNIDHLDRLWQDCKSAAISPLKSLSIRHNLPAGNYLNFVGYHVEADRLLDLLGKKSSRLISIDGIAGSGKTSLVLDVVQRICQAAQPKFAAIVFTSAQASYCLPQGLVSRIQIDRNLSDILRQILITLDTLDIIPTDLTAQLASTRQALAAQSTLLIIDNIETIEDRQSLFAFLQELPPTVTTILTSRVKLGLGEIISLYGIDRINSIILIKEIAAQKNLTITLEQIKLLVQKTSGIPLAINYLLSCAYLAGSIEKLNLDRALLPDQNLTDYCFGNLVSQIRGEFTHQILMALSIFSHPVTRSAALFITNLQDNPWQSLTALKELEFLNLIFQSSTENYELHSLTREYSRRELSQDRRFEQNYLDRWVSYYLNYTEPYGQLDWNEWQDYREIDREWLNIRDVVEYCITTDRLKDFSQLWQNLHGYTLLCGKWAERSIWLEWWVTKIGDCPDLFAKALYHQSQTLAYQNEADPTGLALQLVDQAWNCTENLDPIIYLDLRFEIAIQIAPLYIRQQQSPPLDFVPAHQWLKTASSLLDICSDQRKIDWYRSHILYYQAEIEYLTGNYAQAQRLYLSTKQIAQEIGFQRLTNLARSRLAVTASKLGDLDETSSLLLEALQAAQLNQDRRSIALCQYHLAIVEIDRGNFTIGKTWAEQAITNLDRLFMQQESANLKTLLSQLK